MSGQSALTCSLHDLLSDSGETRAKSTMTLASKSDGARTVVCLLSREGYIFIILLGSVSWIMSLVFFWILFTLFLPLTYGRYLFFLVKFAISLLWKLHSLYLKVASICLLPGADGLSMTPCLATNVLWTLPSSCGVLVCLFKRALGNKSNVSLNVSLVFMLYKAWWNSAHLSVSSFVYFVIVGWMNEM